MITSLGGIIVINSIQRRKSEGGERKKKVLSQSLRKLPNSLNPNPIYFLQDAPEQPQDILASLLVKSQYKLLTNSKQEFSKPLWLSAILFYIIQYSAHIWGLQKKDGQMDKPKHILYPWNAYNHSVVFFVLSPILSALKIYNFSGDFSGLLHHPEKEDVAIYDE